MNKETLEERIALQLKTVTTIIYLPTDPATFEKEFNTLRELSRDYKRITGQYFQVKDNKQPYSRKD